MLEALLVAIAGLVGGFVSTLASNGSSVTLPALELFGLPESAARLAAKNWARVWVYRFLVLVVVLSIVYLIAVDGGKPLHPT